MIFLKRFSAAVSVSALIVGTSSGASRRSLAAGLVMVKLAVGDVVVAEVGLDAADGLRVLALQTGRFDRTGQLLGVGAVDELDVEALAEQVLDVGVLVADEVADL